MTITIKFFLFSLPCQVKYSKNPEIISALHLRCPVNLLRTSINGGATREGAKHGDEFAHN